MKATLQKLSDMIAALPEAQRREIEDAMVAMVEAYLAHAETPAGDAAYWHFVNAELALGQQDIDAGRVEPLGSAMAELRAAFNAKHDLQ